jgi:hypothetical protein
MPAKNRERRNAKGEDPHLTRLKEQAVFEGFEAMRLKSGGVNGPGEYGAWYKETTSGKASLIKQDIRHGKVRHHKILAEVVGGQLLNYLINDSDETNANLSANVSLTKVSSSRFTENTEEKTSPVSAAKNHEDNVYLVSEGIPGYRNDFWKYAYELWNEDHVDDKRTVPEDRPRGMGINPFVKEVMVYALDKLEQLNPNIKREFAKIMAASLLIGDFDVHIGNIGVVIDENGIPHLVRLDYGGALNNLKDDVAPHSITDHLPLLNPRFEMVPTNHFREYPRKYRITKEMAEALEHVAKAPISEKIDKSIAYVKKDFYAESSPGFQSFAEYTGAKSASTTADFLKMKMAMRQQSLRRYAFEIRVDLCVDKNASGKFTINKEMLEILKEHYPEELFALYNEENFRFRRPENVGIFDQPKAREAMLEALHTHYSLEGQKKWVDEKLVRIENKIVQCILQHALHLQIEHGVRLAVPKEFSAKINELFPNKVLSEEEFTKAYQAFLRFIENTSLPGLSELKEDLWQACEKPSFAVASVKTSPQKLQEISFYHNNKFQSYPAEKLDFKTLHKMQSASRMHIYENTVTCHFPQKKEVIPKEQERVIREAVKKTIDRIKPSNIEDLQFDGSPALIATAKKIAQEELNNKPNPKIPLARI